MRFLLFAALSLDAQVVISQVYGGGGNAGATFRNDFVELFNRGGEAVSVNGWAVQYASATGTTWQPAALTGTIEPGRYFLVQLAAGAGGTQDLPRPDATGTLALGAGAGKIRLVNGESVIDLVGYGATANESETAPTRDLSNTLAAIRINAGCTDTNNNSADFVTGAPTPRNSASPRTDCAAPPPTAERLSISAVQGPGDVSPHEGKRVITRGIVYARRASSFYIQSAPADQDNDDRTSEGLLVFTSSAPPPEAAVGNLVDVEGVVTEFRPAADLASPPLTEITSPTVTLLSQNQTLPAATPLADPNWERYEGMRVQVPGAILTSPTGGTLSETTGTSTSNGIFFVSTTAARPFLRADGAAWPVLRVDSRGITNQSVDLRAGKAVAGLLGPLDFGARHYTIVLERGPAITLEADIPPPPVPASAAGEFTIASLNVQRFFAAQTSFDARVAKLKKFITDTLRSPDILALQEVGSPAALDKVAAELTGYLPLVASSNDPSGIACAYLVKRATATVTTAFPIEDPIHDRQPYRLNVRVGSLQFAVLNIHMRSLNNADDPAIALKRRQQAESINRIARGIQGENIPYLIVGDFNTVTFDELIGVMSQGLNLTSVSPLLKNGDEYSYVFNGLTQTLDHVLLSPGMRALITRAAYSRTNADWPESLRADLNFGARVSDHEASMTWFRADPVPFSAFSITNAASYLTGSIAPGEIITVFGRDLTGQRFLVDGREAQSFYQSPTQWTIRVPEQITRGTIAFERAGQTIHSVDVPIVSAAPGLFATAPSGRRGDPIELWGTGIAQSHEVRICNQTADIVYRGQTLGLWQINARIPADCPVGTASAEIASGRRTSNIIRVNVLP